MFDRYGQLLFYAEWNRLRQSGITREEVCIWCVSSGYALVTVSDCVLIPLFMFDFLGSKAYVWDALLNQIICVKNITSGQHTWPARGLPLL